MSKEKSLVEDAIIQMKNLEEAIAENAKGILASTMGQEIKELVKESLNESDEDEEEEVEEEVDSNISDEDSEDEDSEDEDSEDEESEEDGDETDNLDVTSDTLDMDMSDDDTIDMTGHDIDDVLKVYELMGPNDEFVVVKDDSGNLNVKSGGKEYMIVQEGDEEENTMEDTNMKETKSMEMEETQDYSEETIQDIVDSVFSKDSEDEIEVSDDEEIVYEIEMDEDYSEEEEVMEDSDEEDSEEEEVMETYNEEEVMEDSDEEDSEEEEVMEDSDEEYMAESKMSVKPKGLGIGSPKFKYSKKPNTDGGFDVVKKKANKTMGTGKAKFEYKEGENMDGKMKSVKKVETKEASRTLGTGRYFGKKGLPKPKAAPRHLRVESVETELNLLREKNEEYKNALNVFRNKLNEVAVFNSNLAYATRLFTEHSTSKQEKINILKRFDNVESLKESKNLYKQIKDELSNESSKPVNESIERIVENTQSSGSAVNLIESKTYENPQFLRIKDLMSKLKK